MAATGAQAGGAAVEPRLLTAAGTYDTRAPVLSSGKPNRRPDAGRPYTTITWAAILEMVTNPAARSKTDAPLVILSTYVEADGRTHEAQRQRGVFHGLAVDVDAGNPSLDDVVEAVAAVTGGCRALVYSSASARADRRKWRVLLPLATPLAGADYRDTQLALFRLLEAAGIRCDEALARPGQVAYLPNVPPDKRDDDGQPAFYESHVSAGADLELVAGHAIVVEREAIRAAEAAEVAARAQRQGERAAERLAVVDAGGDEFEPIAHFNANHTVAAMLARYGFEQHPRRPRDWRSPLSESGSYSTQDRGDHWVAVSSWAANHNVGRPTRTGHRAGDAWALFVHFEYGGDHAAAVREYAELVRPASRATATPPATPVDELPPPGRVEVLPTPAIATLAAIRNDVADQLRRVLEERPALAVLRHGTGGAKTTTTVPMVAATPGRVVWNVASHAAAAAIVALHHEHGHDDVAAMPPRDATTCRCWTKDDVERVAAAHGVQPGPSMEQALAVGAPMAACVRCPLWPSFKRPANAPKPDPALAAFAPVDDTAMAEAFADPWTDGTTEVPVPEAGGCEYYRRVEDAAKARIVVQCQQRTERQPEHVAAEGWEHSTVVTDEHAMAVLRPRRMVLVDELLDVANVLWAAAGNRGRRLREHASYRQWKRAGVVPDWLLHMRDTAMALVAFAAGYEAAGQRAVVPVPAMPATDKPQPAHTEVMAAVAREALPRNFNPAALDLVWMAAAGRGIGAELAVQDDAGGTWHASFNWSWHLDLPAGVAHIALDASADVGALRRMRPDAVVIDPPGVAALCHDARHWLVEVNNDTHPAVVLAWAERAVEAVGWADVALFLPKRHRRVLFPQERPRRGPPRDLPADVEAIANWNTGRRELAGDPTRRMAVALDCARRVERLRAALAKDEHGNVLVDHHHGGRARGSNEFMAGACKAVAVIGHVRRPPRELASYMLATGLGDAVAVDGGWGDVEGQVPHVDGGTRTVRWRGYADERWAEAARVLSRADLEQLAARARPNLPGPGGGVPLLVVAGEPCGLPLADPPAVVPAGVAAVVEVVRGLVAGATGPTLSNGAVVAGGGRGKVGKRGTTTDGVAGASESRQPCTGNTSVPSLYTVGGIPPGVTTAVVAGAVDAPRRSVERWLADAVAMGLLARHGAGRATRYGLPGPPAEVAGPPPAAPPLAATTGVVEAGPVGPVLEVPPPLVDGVGGQTGIGTTRVGHAGVKKAPPERARGPHPAPVPVVDVQPTATPATATGIVGPTDNPPPRPTSRLTGPRAAVVAELRGKLRAAAWDARVAHMAGVCHEGVATGIMAGTAGATGPP